MLIQITNTCDMQCKHCLHNSLPQEMHMDEETVKETFDFCAAAGVKAVVITGGEPTMHPHFKEIVLLYAGYFPLIYICSNGTFIFNEQKTKDMKELLSLGNVHLQVYTHKDYYPGYDLIMKRKKDFEELENTVFTHDDRIFIHQIGRAANDEFCKVMAKNHPYTTSCLMAASTFWQMPFNKAINNMESRGHVCTPLVDWKGKIHMSESCLCPSIGDIREFNKFNSTVQFKPCGACADYQKILDNHSFQYEMIKKIMNLK